MSETYRDKVLLQCEGLSVVYGESVILRDVNFEVRDLVRPGHVTGQVIGLLGPSGRGKTQLFRRIAGLDAPTTGFVRIAVNGELRPVQRGEVGVVAQHYPLFEHRSVLQNLVIAGRQANLSPSAAKERAMELLERFQLAHRAGFYPAQLSGGQRQRVAIAQQLMCSSHVFLMDEPFSGLDPEQVDKVIGLVFEVAGMHELNTIVVVTHDVTAAVLAADTIWTLGYDRDAEGNPIPGARIQEVIDLEPRGLAWWQHPTYESPNLAETVRELRVKFKTL
ncbi:MAG: ATP-binding cassette domain-containing protein [bacterium]|nr:ATP-binding cassette domain-containing protein [bacterium]